MTPASFSKGGSMHQKQPPAKVAVSRLAAVAGGVKCRSAEVTKQDPQKTNSNADNVTVKYFETFFMTISPRTEDYANPKWGTVGFGRTLMASFFAL